MNRPRLRGWLVKAAVIIGIASLPHVSQAQTGGTGGLGGAGGGGAAGGGGGGQGQTVGQGQTLSTSFSGGNAGSSFSGGVSFSGGGATGSMGPGTSTNVGRLGGSGAALAPSTSNPFRQTYINPLSPGLFTVGQTGSVTKATGATAVFGQALFPITATGGNVGGNIGGGAGALGGRTAAGGNLGGGVGGLTGNQSTGFSTFGVPRAPLYVTTLDESIPAVQYSAPEMTQKIETVLRGSTSLRKFGNVDFAVEAGTVVLRGEVGNPRERKLAEAVVRLTPGVREVRNELTVRKE